MHLYKQNFVSSLFPWEQYFRVLAFTGLSHGLAPNFQIPNVFDDVIHSFHQKYVNKITGNNFLVGSGAFWLTVPPQRHVTWLTMIVKYYIEIQKLFKTFMPQPI